MDKHNINEEIKTKNELDIDVKLNDKEVAKFINRLINLNLSDVHRTKEKIYSYKLSQKEKQFFDYIINYVVIKKNHLK